MLIHTDKSKTKEKEAQEQVRQRNGEAPTETFTSPRFKVGIEEVGLTDVLVETTNSGSMMQEVFLVYAKHFVNSLPPGHGPVILFLDGHPSRWHRDALKLFTDNKVFTFFLASHTSIWSQPNDAGVNKRFHWAVEQVCKDTCHTLEYSDMRYFNTNFIKGWRQFLDTE